MNPFLTNIRNFQGERVAALDAMERIRMVERFNAYECEQASKVPDLQATVETAIAKRLRKLERACAPR